MAVAPQPRQPRGQALRVLCCELARISSHMLGVGVCAMDVGAMTVFLYTFAEREKIYNFLHQELPYETAVETTSWKDLKDGSVRIEQTIYVARESQRKIMLGKSGQTVKKISLTARKELAETLERNVHLFLFVKVRENWSTDPGYFREMGLDYPGDD